MKLIRSLMLSIGSIAAMHSAFALPSAQDRVYTADQNSNTVSVFNPATNTLLGQIRLGNQRPDVLSPLYKGEINVHGLGFSPDHKTLMVISTGSNSATFIDTATNKVKGKAYLGRSPHEGFFTADGKEAWVVVRGEDYISVIDPQTFREKQRIKTGVGPGMVQFHPDGKLAFVVSSFTPTVDIIDVKTKKVVKRLAVTSPFSPFLQFTPDFSEIWMTHKDVGKVTRIDTRKLEVTSVIDTGFITNHLAFAKVNGRAFAYVTIGGENVVKVFTTDKEAKLVSTIQTGALPHGIWSSGDGSRVYVGLENGDGIQVIDTASNQITATIAGGQAPQALVYVPHAVPKGEGRENLVARANGDAVNLRLHAVSGEGRGFLVSRNLGVVDALEVSLFKLKPNTEYSVYLNGAQAPAGSFMTNSAGMANGTMIGPVREWVRNEGTVVRGNEVLVIEGHGSPASQQAVLKAAP